MNKDEKYFVIVSAKATNMLVSHAIFLSRVNEDAAEKLVQAFEEVVKSLEFMPQRSPWINSTSLPFNKYRKLLFNKRYLLLYQTQDNTVSIDFVLDCRQDFDWLVK